MSEKYVIGYGKAGDGLTPEQQKKFDEMADNNMKAIEQLMAMTPEERSKLKCVAEEYVCL